MIAVRTDSPNTPAIGLVPGSSWVAINARAAFWALCELFEAIALIWPRIVPEAALSPRPPSSTTETGVGERVPEVE